MKLYKVFSIWFFILFNSQFIFAQYNWYWQYPKPAGSHLEDCFFTNESTGYAVGWDGTVIKTTNGGNNWNQLNTGSNRFYYSIFFTNQSTGYLASGDDDWSPQESIILKTTNEGITWEQIFSVSNTHIGSIYFINDSIGFIVGGVYVSNGGRIFKTTNSGINWIQYYASTTTNNINSIYFTNDSVGYVAGDDGRMLKTTNQGLNWISIANSGTYFYQFNSIYFLNENTGFVAGENGALYKTTNEGLNWQAISSGITDDLWNIKFINSDTGFIVAGGRFTDVTGKILRTTNSGNTWEIIQLINTNNYRGLAVFNNNIYAVGYWGTVIKSSNRGLNWIDFSNTMQNNNITDFKIFDSLKFLAVCNNGNSLITSNGGGTWSISNLGINYHLNSVFFIDQNTGYIAGGYSIFIPPTNTSYYSKIYKSTNGGINWNLIFGLNNEPGELKSIIFISNNTGFSVGSGGILRKTTNSGTNWITQYLGSDWLNSVSFINPNTGFISGSNGNIYKTTDSGGSWVLINTGFNLSLYSIAFPSDNTGYIASNNQVIKTTNGGLNWVSNNITLSYSFQINKISFLDNNIGFAVGLSFPIYGRAGEIFKTTNGGINWQHLSFSSTNPTYQRRGLNSIQFLNENTGYIMGEIATILKTTNGGSTIYIIPISSKTPNSISMYQNYPNPFNPTTIIKFDVAMDSRFPGNDPPWQVVLKVYDVMGREVQTLVNERLQPGTYEVSFDGSSLTSGVYFYKLITNGYTETRKMLLLK